MTLHLESLTNGRSREIILDSSFVEVRGITVDDEKVEWDLKDRFEPYGSPLIIKVPAGRSKGEMIRVKMEVSTTAECTALQWLTPAQTKGEHPYMVNITITVRIPEANSKHSFLSVRRSIIAQFSRVRIRQM